MDEKTSMVEGVKLDLSHIRIEMKGIERNTKWSRYGYCDICYAIPGIPCRNMSTSKGLDKVRPHKGRDRLDQNGNVIEKK